ncbi:MAG: DsbC family protein [Nitrospiraceae bacterium]|nr:DsbC family protein [Nitrospiraceae bacterium]
MKKLLLSAITIALAITVSHHQAFAFAKGEQDCAKCHTLNAEQARDVLKAIIPDVKILGVKNGPINGLWEIAVEAGNKKGIMYIDFGKKNLIAGSIIDIQTRKNYTQASYEVVNKIDVAAIPLGDAFVLGDKDAKHKIIVFSDPDCPFCGKLHQEMKKVVEKRKDIAFFIKLFPLPMHPDAARKAKAIACAHSLAMLDDAFAKKPIPDPKCDTKIIDENIKLGEKLGISGTPSLIFPNGKLIAAALDADKIIEEVDKK